MIGHFGEAARAALGQQDSDHGALRHRRVGEAPPFFSEAELVEGDFIDPQQVASLQFGAGRHHRGLVQAQLRGQGRNADRFGLLAEAGQYVVLGLWQFHPCFLNAVSIEGVTYPASRLKSRSRVGGRNFEDGRTRGLVGWGA